MFENFGTLIVGLVLFGVAGVIVFIRINARRKGKSIDITCHCGHESHRIRK
jgi:hypothetical protein